jgi:predicted nucleic acid-binding protein
LKSQERILAEAITFYLLIKLAEENKIEIVISEAHIYENSKMADPLRRTRVRNLFNLFHKYVIINSEVAQRAQEIGKFGFGPIDSIHIACAESGAVDFFVTCDDGLLKLGKRNSDRMTVRVIGLLDVLGEVFYVKNAKTD